VARTVIGRCFKGLVYLGFSVISPVLSHSTVVKNQQNFKKSALEMQYVEYSSYVETG
jgi:hypothetical protein